MNIPTLDLCGLKPYEVNYAVTKFIEHWRRKGLFVDVLTDDNEEKLFEAVKVIKQYGLEFHTGLPHHQGKIRVVLYDEYH